MTSKPTTAKPSKTTAPEPDETEESVHAAALAFTGTTTMRVAAFLHGIEASGPSAAKDGAEAGMAYEATLKVVLNASDLPAFTALLDGKGMLTLEAKGQPLGGRLVSADYLAVP